MKMDELREVALKVYDAIFQKLKAVTIDELEYPFIETSRSKVKYVNIGGYTFIEQNPKKSSRWGKMAREGHKIMWVMKGRRYLVQVKDGKYIDLKKKD